ncbi:MAG: ABC transporter permease [Acidimicrobiales bacterium]
MTLVKLALKNITSRPGRFILTSLAVLIGVALTTAVFVLTDSLRETFGDLSGDIESGYDIAVRSEVPFGDRLNAAPVGLEVPPLLEDLDGVAAVQPRVIEFGIVPNTADGDAATSQGPNIGVNWEDQGTDVRLFSAEGRPATSSDEFMIDIDAAEDDEFQVGERYDVQTPEGLVNLQLVGTFTFADPEENALVGAKLVAFETATAVDLLNSGRGYDDVTITLEAGADEAAVIAAASEVVPDGLEVIPREVLVDEQADTFNEFIDIFRTILLVFAFIILLVAAFIIYNVFSIIVGQRIQEIGLLRALGATGRQITRSIAVEALGVGVFATVVGVAIGVPLAGAIQALLAAAEFGPEDGSTPLRLTTVIVAILLGVGLTLVAAIWPALRARSVSPMAALRADVSFDQSTERQPLIGGVLTLFAALAVVLGFLIDQWLFLLLLSVVAGVLLYLGLSRIDRRIGRASMVGLAAVLLVIALVADFRASILLALLGAAALIAFLGMNLLSPSFATPVARAIGAPFARLGVPSRMARENAGRSPERTATAASALMIGLALVTAVAVVVSSLKATFADVLDEAVTADWIVIGDNQGPGTGFSPKLGEDLAQLEELEAVLPVTWNEDAFRTVVDDDVRTSYSTNLVDIELHFAPDYIDKDESLMTETGVIVHEDRADDLELNVGSTVALEFVDQVEREFTVAAIYSDLAIFDSGWVLDSQFWEQNEELPAQEDLYVTMITADDVSEADARAAIATVTDEFPQLDAQTKDEFRDDQEESINQVLTIVIVLLQISVVLAILGIAITLALSVFERTREIGLTRAVGATRKQMKRTVRVEGIIVALFGGTLGIGLGLIFGVACVQIIPDDFVSKLAIPWGTLVLNLVTALIAGLLAAYFPARRAAKLNVLDAIAHGG